MLIRKRLRTFVRFSCTKPRVVYLGLLCLLISPGCEHGKRDSAGERGAPPAETQRSENAKGRIGLLWNTLQIQACVAQLEAAQSRVSEHGYEFIVYDANLDIAKQLDGMENMIQQKVDAIVVIPVDSRGIISAIKKANFAGIPVVTQDVNAEGGEVYNYIGTDNYRAGELTGEYLVWRLKGRGKIVLLHYNRVSSAYERWNGLMNVIKHYTHIEILASQEAMTIELGMDIMSHFLQAHSDLDAVWAVNDPSGLGALRAVKAAGRDRDLFIVAIDGDPEAVKEIKSGGAYAMTVAQFPVELSNNAVDAAVAAIEGGKALENVQIIGRPSPMPHYYTPVLPITIENVDQYLGWNHPAPEMPPPPWWK